MSLVTTTEKEKQADSAVTLPSNADDPMITSVSKVIRSIVIGDNMVQKAMRPREIHYNSDNDEWEDAGDEEINNYAEYTAINAKLDQLNSVLDNLEKKNDDIHAEIMELLQSTREARKQFQDLKNIN